MHALCVVNAVSLIYKARGSGIGLAQDQGGGNSVLRIGSADLVALSYRRKMCAGRHIRICTSMRSMHQAQLEL